MSDREPRIEIRRRAFQRTTNLRVLPNGTLRISTNKTTPDWYLQQFLKHHADWIEEQKKRYVDLRKKNPAKQFILGEGFLFQGKTYPLNFAEGKNKKFSFAVQDDSLTCFVPSAQWKSDYIFRAQKQILQPLLQFYREQGCAVLLKQLEVRAHEMKLHPRKVIFRAGKTRWGSCSSEGVVSLNWKLIAAPPMVLDYVIVHELAHLVHHNHSKAFWGLVEAHCSTWREQRSWLRKNAYLFDFLHSNSDLHGV